MKNLRGTQMTTPKYFRLYDKEGTHIADVPNDPENHILLLSEYDLTYLGVNRNHVKYKVELL